MQCVFFPFKRPTLKPDSNSRLLNQNTIKVFNERLLAADWFEILLLQDVNLAFSKFMQKISDAFDVCISVVKSSNFNAKINPWFDKELKTLQKDKRKAYFKFLRLRDSSSKTAYNCIKNHFERTVKF